MLEISIQAALVSSCIDDMVSAGLQDRSQAESFFINNDSNFILEVQAALQDKSSQFVAADITFFKELLVDLQKNKISTGAPLKTTQLLSNAAELDRKRFDLDMESLTHDLHLIQMFVCRLADRNINNYHAKLAWSSDRELKIQQAAETIAKSRVKLFDGDKSPAVLMKEIEAFQNELKTVTQQKDLASIHLVPYINWISPSLVLSKQQNMQSTLAGLILNDTHRDNVGIVLMPQYTYHAGQLYKQENAVLEKLHKNHILTDTKFAIPLQSRRDSRDKRPLVMDGRMISGNNGIDVKSVWTDCRLQKTQVLKPTPQLAQTEMINSEIMDDDNNPLNLMDGKVEGAAKWAQLSIETNTELISALMEDLPPYNKVIVALDLVPGPGGFASAAVDLMVKHRDLFYAGIGKDDAHNAFLQQTCTQRICEMVKNGTMSVPTIKIPPSDPPAEVMQQNPVRPQLAALEWENSTDGTTALIPSALNSKWNNHEHFAIEFQKVKETLAKHDILVAGVAGHKKTGKRGADLMGEGKPVKKPRIEAKLSLPLSEDMKAEVPMVQSGIAAGQIFIGVTASDRLYLINKHSETVVVPEHTLLGYFGKGSFMTAKGQEPLPQSAIHWDVKQDTQIVIFNGVGQTVRSIVVDKKNESPKEAHVWAHKITDVPTAASPFAMHLQSMKQVGWVPKKSEKEPADSFENIGLKVPCTKWFNQCSVQTWTVKWSPMNKGLAPVKPVIMLTCEVCLPPLSAIELCEAKADAEDKDDNDK